ncbi:MAG TPA: DNA polymerase III subunit delta' [Ideonella sp.]|nr:DNA polymerase III subunit delta' [Ideonella sp.]
MALRDEHDLPWLAAPLQALRDHERGHALILHGRAGSGLFELALRVAQAWLCEQPPGPCGVCPGCHLTLARSHPDLKVLMPETLQQAIGWNAGGDSEGDAGDGDSKARKKPSREIKVEAVRQAIDWAHTSSGRGRGKVLVLNPADAMNAVAANALLKTLEEPAAGVRLLLCVDDPERLLPTIRSRCQRVRLPAPSEAEALQWLGGQGVKDPAVLLRASGGEPLSALALGAEGLTAESWAALPGQVAAGDSRVLAALPPARVVHVLQQICHDAMAAAAGAPPRYFPTGSLQAGADWAALAEWSRTLARTARHDEHPWNAGLLIESLVSQGTVALNAGPAAHKAGRYT